MLKTGSGAASGPGGSMERISCQADVDRGLEALLAADPRLVPVYGVAETVPLRLAPGGFSGLASIIVSQQISRAAADAIWGRVCAQLGAGRAREGDQGRAPVTMAALLDATDADLQGCGLSRSKIQTLRAIAQACEGGLDLDALSQGPPEAALEILIAIKGVGPWTAEVYLLFCCGHADIFPAGDVALQTAVKDAFALAVRPMGDELREIAASWSPWRGIAARLLWSYYRARRDGRDAIPV